MAKITLPGLIDMHVHLRDPGQTEKEDFYTGTSAALAGGFTKVFDMPNNLQPITHSSQLAEKIKSAKTKVVCDTGFYFGSLGNNIAEFEKIKDKVFGIKLYLNPTTGDYLINTQILEIVMKNWPRNKLILVHAEEDVIGQVMEMVRKFKRPVHVCHVSSENELKPILKAKDEGLPVTCGVTPHHLFLTEDDVKTLGPYGRMKPSLKSKKNQEFLWKNLKKINVVESDHAPHTKKEKEADPPLFGVPGLETTLPLLLSDKRVSTNEIIRLCYESPRKILGLPEEKNTKTIIDGNAKSEIKNSELLTKCGWSPFNGWKVRGKIQEVYIRGTRVFENRKILVKPGSGQVLVP